MNEPVFSLNKRWIHQWILFGRKLFLAIAIIMVYPTLFVFDNPRITNLEIIVFASPLWVPLLLMTLHIVAAYTLKKSEKISFRSALVAITIVADVTVLFALLFMLISVVEHASLFQ
jgi:hypothetical protein